MSDRDTEEVVVWSCSQGSKSEFLLNVLGYHIDQDPGPVLLVQPTLELADAFSSDRIAPMIRDTPALQGKVKDPRSRDSGNTLRRKVFPGGRLNLAGANSAASLAGRPIRVVLCDEIDRYPFSAGSEGDPVTLARRRTENFWNAKVALTSTATIDGLSRIQDEYDGSDQRHHHARCPDCGREQRLVWAQVRWPNDRPEEARYVCAGCGSLWDDAKRHQAIRAGRWIASKPFAGRAGFHFSRLDLVWSRLEKIVRQWLEAQGSPEKLKVFVNTVLAETWKESLAAAKPGDLEVRAEQFDHGLEGSGTLAPAGVLVVTVGIDVQQDRVEIERVGWGMEEESWSLHHEVLLGSPFGPDLWNEVDAYLKTPSWSEDGRKLPVKATCIDSGFATQQVYRFCVPRFGRRVYAIKGIPGEAKPIWPKKTLKAKDSSVRLFGIGVSAAKDVVLGRLAIAEPGPGYCRFPAGRESAWFQQLTNEKSVIKYHKGRPRREFQKRPQDRVEALDCRVYAYAALQSLHVRSWASVKVAAEKAASGRVPTPPRPGSREWDQPREIPKLRKRRRLRWSMPA